MAGRGAISAHDGAISGVSGAIVAHPGCDLGASRPYLAQVLSGLFGLCNRLFGVDIVEAEKGTFSAWHEDVQFFKVALPLSMKSPSFDGRHPSRASRGLTHSY